MKIEMKIKLAVDFAEVIAQEPLDQLTKFVYNWKQ
jgi:hypothetical protein